MSKRPTLYQIIRQTHLYSSLATAALLLMYIITSYMMIYHELFKVERNDQNPTTIKITPEDISNENWESFLDKNNIRGRLTRENFRNSGDLVRTYSSTKGNSKITIFHNKNEVEIVSTELNISGKIIGLHRLRGYGGSILYSVYAFLLDIVGFSLILFAATGIILWMKLLKNNKIAWTILILGFTYVSTVIGYLMFV